MLIANRPVLYYPVTGEIVGGMMTGGDGGLPLEKGGEDGDGGGDGIAQGPLGDSYELFFATLSSLHNLPRL